jgi:DNA invertase Pin-like site-specific DNA recombinase
MGSVLEPAIGYVRVSMAREEMVSPELQRAAITDKAARDGCEIAEWVEELDVSGRLFGRTGVQKVIGLVRDGTYRRAYVWKYSRFGRNATYVGLYVQQMEEAGGQLVSATDDVGSRTAAQRFARGMIWAADEFQSNVIGENWKETHARRRRAGLPHNGTQRFGYLYHHASIGRFRCPLGCGVGGCETGYSPDPVTAPHAAHMFELYNSGTSVLKIAVHLNDLGLLTPAGKPWDQRQVRKYMDSGFPAGLLRVHDPACDHATSEAAQKCKRKVLIPGAHEPLISEQVWVEYLRQRGARRKLPPRVEAPVYPLAGLVRCGRCGGPLNAHGEAYKGIPRPGYLYACATYIRSRECEGTWIARHRVEDVALAWLEQFAGDIEAAARAQRGRIRQRATVDLDRKRLEKRIADDARDLAALALQLARGLIPEPAYITARDERLASQEQAQEALDALAPPPPDRAPMAAVALRVVRDWNILSPAGRRAILGEYIAHVAVVSHGKSRATVTVTATWGEATVYDI